jgi:hypothetical protein
MVGQYQQYDHQGTLLGVQKYRFDFLLRNGKTGSYLNRAAYNRYSNGIQ